MSRPSERALHNRAPVPSSFPSPVLVVDDVQANLISLNAVLDDMGCDVVLARSGNEALRELLRREFALVLLDVQMPEMDGYEVAHHVRQHPATKELPIIFLTAALHSEEGVLRGYGTGAVDFLFKPINPVILRSKVRVFLELHARRRQLADAKETLERANAELHELATANASLANRFKLANDQLESAYHELQTTQARLVQSAKMASLGELVAGVAHEINNPLAFVISHLETVQRSLAQVRGELATELSESCQQHWARAEDRLSGMTLGLERIRELVVKLRAFSRLDEGEQKRVSVRECVESMLTILGHRLQDGIEVQTRFGEPDEVECFPSLLNQAVMNLVSNAIDAIGTQGTLTISTGQDGDAYSITVEDTGHGIPEGLRQRVLEPFFTTKPVGEGTGLGLSITYSIVRKHGGTLDLRSRDSGGTAAVIRIPLSSKGKD